MSKDLTTIVPMLRRFAYSLTGNMADADDLLQNTVERLLNKPMPDDVELNKWAFRICRNLWIDDYRAKKVRAATDVTDDLSDNLASPEEKQISDANLKQLNNAMDILPSDQRSILSLVAMQGLSYQEVADILCIPIGTVMSRIARARISIKETIKYQLGSAT